MTLKYIWRSFSLSCHFHDYFSYPWHAFASHGLPATAELLVLSTVQTFQCWMSSAISVFKLNIVFKMPTSCSNVRKSSLFRNNRIAVSVNSCGKSFHRQQGSLQLGNVGRFWREFLTASQHRAPHFIIQWILSWPIRWLFVFPMKPWHFLI